MPVMIAFSCLFAILIHEVFPSVTPDTSTSNERKLLLISLDGFRHDYLEKAEAFGVNISAFKQIWASGFRALRVENEFITRTAPSHFSLVTGQHEETHGVVDNVFYDPYLNKTFMFNNSSQAKESVWFDNGAEPIWVTNQLHGHRSAVTSWPGSVARIKGLLPSVYYTDFDPNRSFHSSIDDVISWLESDINLALLYHPQPDAIGHEKGPASAEVLHVIGDLNHDLDYLLQRIKTSPYLKSTLNIILTSDHGMTDVDPSRTIVLDDFLNSTMYSSPGANVRILWGLWPAPGHTAHDIFVQLQRKHPKLNVYFKEDVPTRLFYSNNRRIAPIVLFSEPGWLIAKSKQDALSLTRRGDHGYDPSFQDMSPFFLATGPGFQSFPPYHTIPSLQMVDIYPMMCHLLGLDHPGPHNGSLSRVATLLRITVPPVTHWFHSSVDVFTGVLLFIVLIVPALAIVFYLCLSPCLTSAGSTQRLRRARKRRGLQQPGQMVRLHRLNHTGASNGSTAGPAQPLPAEDVQRLLLASNEDDEVEQFSQSRKFVIDDSTLIGMLRDPHLRFP